MVPGVAESGTTEVTWHGRTRQPLRGAAPKPQAFSTKSGPSPEACLTRTGLAKPPFSSQRFGMRLPHGGGEWPAFRASDGDEA